MIAIRKVSLAVAVIISFILANSVSATAAQFDLICNETEHGMSVDGVYEPKKSIGVDYSDVRIGLDEARKTWCYQPCRMVGEAEYSSSEIRLSGGPTGLGPSYLLINRNKGTMIKRVYLNKSMYLVFFYDCKKAKYTGIPAARF